MTVISPIPHVLHLSTKRHIFSLSLRRPGKWPRSSKVGVVSSRLLEIFHMANGWDFKMSLLKNRLRAFVVNALIQTSLFLGMMEKTEMCGSLQQPFHHRLPFTAHVTLMPVPATCTVLVSKNPKSPVRKHQDPFSLFAMPLALPHSGAV
jgi:hypothetical protein